MADFRLTPDMIGANNYEYYDPAFCDGHHCPRDCERCAVADEILEAQEQRIQDSVEEIRGW